MLTLLKRYALVLVLVLCVLLVKPLTSPFATDNIFVSYIRYQGILTKRMHTSWMSMLNCPNRCSSYRAFTIASLHPVFCATLPIVGGAQLARPASYAAILVTDVVEHSLFASADEDRILYWRKKLQRSEHGTVEVRSELDRIDRSPSFPLPFYRKWTLAPKPTFSLRDWPP